MKRKAIYDCSQKCGDMTYRKEIVATSVGNAAHAMRRHVSAMCRRDGLKYHPPKSTHDGGWEGVSIAFIALPKGGA